MTGKDDPLLDAAMTMLVGRKPIAETVSTRDIANERLTRCPPHKTLPFCQQSADMGVLKPLLRYAALVPVLILPNGSGPGVPTTPALGVVGAIDLRSGEEGNRSQSNGESVIRALRERRSMTRSRQDEVPRELVELVIESATWGPNHRRTCPWRFVVLTGKARSELGRVMAEAYSLREQQKGVEVTGEQLEKERNKPLRAPVVIAVFAVPSDDPRVVEVEEVEAVAVGVQNMLLTAAALGLGAMWRTGDAAYDQSVKAHLGFTATDHLVAFVYLGYPDLLPPLRRDQGAAQYTRWATANLAE